MTAVMLTEPLSGRNPSPSMSPVATIPTTDNCSNLFVEADSITIRERFDSHDVDVALLRQYSASAYMDTNSPKNYYSPSANVRPYSAKDILEDQRGDTEFIVSLSARGGVAASPSPPCSTRPIPDDSNHSQSSTTATMHHQQQHSSRVHPSQSNATSSATSSSSSRPSSSPPRTIPAKVPTDHSTSSPSTVGNNCPSPTAHQPPVPPSPSPQNQGQNGTSNNSTTAPQNQSNHTVEPLVNASPPSTMTTSTANKHRYSCSIGGPSSSMSHALNRKGSVPVSQDLASRAPNENAAASGVSTALSGTSNRVPIRNRESNSSQLHRSQGRNHTEPRNRSIVSATARSCCLCCISFKSIPENISRGTSSVDPPQSKVEAVIYDEGVTYEEALKWSQSFDCLMASPPGREIFHEFLKSEYSEENILFWLACEELKRETTSEGVEEKARLIYEDFISILSPKEVSLDSRVREIINSNMLQPTAYTFEEAQQQVYTLMQRDSYSRFINSKIYKEALSRARGSADQSLLHLSPNQSHS